MLGKTNETLTEFVGELRQFNVAKTGELKIVLSSQNDVIWPDVTRIYYHFLLILILESKLQHNSIKRLEIQLDFLCDQCRSFFGKTSWASDICHSRKVKSKLYKL